MNAAIVILAAGSGTRMNSSRPKVLHEIAGAPMLWHVMKAAETVSPSKIIVVTGRQEDAIRNRLSDFGMRPEFAVQEKPAGTADAVAAARRNLQGFGGALMILYGDAPLIRPDTLIQMMNPQDIKADLRVLGFHAEDPKSYGRLVVDDDGAVERIVEFRDAGPAEKDIRFCNSGVIAADSGHLFSLIDEVVPDNSAGEFYLPDVVGIARSRGMRCQAVSCAETEALGINNRAELSAAEGVFQGRARNSAMERGAVLQAPDTVFFSYDTVLEPDCTVEPYVVFEPGVKIESGARIRPYSHLAGCLIRNGAVIGPFARIRPASIVESGARVGNFVEIKQARIGGSAKASHLSYIGDAEIGDGANIGAGSITCNFDGKSKHRTIIGQRAFIGSDTILVAPVEIGESAMTAAGSVITSDIPAGSLGVARGRLSVIKGFAKRFFGNSSRREKNENRRICAE